MVVTTGGFQSWRCLTSGMSKVSRYPSAEPDPAAIRRAERRTMASFFGERQNERQNGVRVGGPPAPVGGVPPEPEGGAPEGGPATGGRPVEGPPVKEEPKELKALRSPVLKGPLAAEGA